MQGIDALGLALRLSPPLGGFPGGVLSGLSQTNLALAHVQQQIALGRAMLSPSDDPSRSNALARLDAMMALNTHLGGKIDRATSLLGAADSPLSSAISILGAMHDLGVSAQADNLTQQDRDTMADQIDQAIDQLLGEANKKFDGVYLFGGSRADLTPWEKRTEGVAWLGRGDGLDVGAGALATISGHTAFGGSSARIDLQGRVSLSQGLETPLASWGAGPLSLVRVTVGSQSQVVDLSGAVTLRDFKNIMEGLNFGVRVEYDTASGKAWVRNGLSGASMSISDVGADNTASRLGIDTFASYTNLSDFNDGRGVRFAQPNIDPVSGEPAAGLSGADFSIRLHNGAIFNVDLTNETTVGQVLNTINAAAAAAGIGVPGSFSASLNPIANGILLTDNTAGGLSLQVAPINNSWAADDLGILGGVPGAQLAGEDRAQVAVDGAFSHLIRLRDAIRNADLPGTTFAVQGLERDLVRAAEAQSTVGGRNQRLQDQRATLDEQTVQNQSLRSSLADLDMPDAANRLSALTTQLQAGMLAIGRTGTLSLLDFLK